MTLEFLLFCIATVGMTLIITQGSILRPFREFLGNWAEKIRERRELKEQATGKKAYRSLVEWLSELINCAQCTGFWCGLFCCLLIYDAPSCLRDFSVLFCFGLGGSFLASLGSNLIDWIFYRKMNALRQLEEQDMILAERRANAERI